MADLSAKYPARLSSALTVFILLLMLVPTSASCLELDEIPPLPEYTDISEKEFIQQTRLIDTDFERDPHLDFTVRIPKDWESSEDASLRNYILSKKVVGEIARYYSPPMHDKRSSFSVSAMEMEHKITGKNWFIHYVFTEGFTLQGIEVVSDSKVIAHYVLIEDDTPYSVRAVALNSGKRIVLAQYYVPLDHAEENAAMQEKVIESFELTDPDTKFSESTDTYAFLDLVEFDYPLSWELRTPAINDIVKMHAYIINLEGSERLYGKVDVYILDKDETDLGKEIAAILDKMKKKNMFETGDLIETIDGYEFGSHVEAAKVEVYELNSSQRRSWEYEFWVAILSEKEEYNYLITMLTPSREADFYSWAQNIEVFRFVSESVRPGIPVYDR